MSTLRRIGLGVGLMVLGVGAFAGLSAPAQAMAAHPTSVTNCTYGHNGALLTATCSAPADQGWYLRLTCMRYANSAIYHANGSLVYGAGTSQATCGRLGEPLDEEIVELS